MPFLFIIFNEKNFNQNPPKEQQKIIFFLCENGVIILGQDQ